MRLSLVLGIVGHLLRYFSAAFLIPALVATIHDGIAVAGHFLIAGGIAYGLGSLLGRLQRPGTVFRRSEALGVVAGTWLIVAIVAAIPYWLGGLSMVDAFFESMSGLTTTGATILTDFSQHGRAFFLWRAMTQWFGGMGVIALFVVVLPRLGIAGRQIFFAEASGATSDVISPQVRSSAARLWTLYVVLTLLESVALIVAGLKPYDALLNSMTTLAAGGFSPHGESIMGYHNPAAEWVIVIFMFLAGASFTLQWKGFTGSPKQFWRDGEFRLYLAVTVIGALTVAGLLAEGWPGLGELRAGAFQSASLISSTGFASENYDLWSDANKAVLIGIMFVGGCAGSAAGGAKVIRLLIVAKFVMREISQVVHPRAVISIRYRGRVVPREALRAVFTLVLLYIVGYLLIGMTVVALGADLVTGFSASLACLGNIGPGFSLVGPMANYAHFPTVTKLILTLAMWVGRLEVIAVLALLHQHVWGNLRWR